jgi:hypothetical protein
MTTRVQSGRQVLELSAIRKGVWPVEETGESIAAVEALSAEDHLAPTLLESIVTMLKYIQDDMWLMLDLVLAAVLIARLYLSFSYGLTAELSAAGIANVSIMDRLSAVSGVLLIAGEENAAAANLERFTNVELSPFRTFCATLDHCQLHPSKLPSSPASFVHALPT